MDFCEWTVRFFDIVLYLSDSGAKGFFRQRELSKKTAIAVFFSRYAYKGDPPTVSACTLDSFEFSDGNDYQLTLKISIVLYNIVGILSADAFSSQSRFSMTIIEYRLQTCLNSIQILLFFSS